VIESYYCNYGVNAAYLERLVDGGLRVCGVGEEGEVRIVELPDHPFFMGTLFLPQARSTRTSPHPLLLGYAAALGGRR
jgi:CTP synthase (UTP-ammonia lyase)